MSNIAKVKNIVMAVLSDYEEHTTEEFRKSIQKEGIRIDEKSSALRTAIYQLRNNGINIDSRERGIYQLSRGENMSKCLEGFVLLKPEVRFDKRYVYVHADGKIVLNGKLNNDIKSRKIEIRTSVDCEKMVLIIDGENAHKFTKSGSTINKEFIKRLSRKKIGFPITYEMNREGNNMWMGEIKKIEK